MRKYLTISLLILALSHGVDAQADALQNQSPKLGDSTNPSKELIALEQFLRMSEDQLAAMADAIDRVRNMSPEERRKLEQQISAYRKLPAMQREQIRLGWHSEQDWKDWREMMSGLAEEERAAIQSTLQAMPFKERADHKHKLLEAWRAGKGKGK